MGLISCFLGFRLPEKALQIKRAPFSLLGYSWVSSSQGVRHGGGKAEGVGSGPSGLKVQNRIRVQRAGFRVCGLEALRFRVQRLRC